MGIERYNSYTESGVEWIGKIPVHWSIKRLKFLTKESLKYGANVPAELIEPDFPRYVRITDVDANGNLKDDTFRSIEPEIAQQYLLQEGDILLARSGATVGKSFIYKDTWGQAAYAGYLIRARINNKKYDPQFLYYTTKSDGYNQWIESITIQATIQNVSAEKYASLYFSIPPAVEEQQSIANFLDKEVSRLDTLIEKKQQFIERLKEKRLAVITNAVTKGIDPSVELKPSGISWIDFIPRNWSTGKLKWYTNIYSGGTPDKSIDEYWEEGTVPWINSGAVNQRLITEPSTHITQEAFLKSSAKWITKGSLVMALAGQGKTKGMAAQLDIDTTCNQSMAAIVFKDKLMPRYVLHWMEINYQNIRNLAGGDQRDGLNLEMIGSIQCLIPTAEEQKSIVKYVDKEDIKVNELISKTTKAIDKLQEYKTALISAAVTGKIKVTEPS